MDFTDGSQQFIEFRQNRKDTVPTPAIEEPQPAKWITVPHEDILFYIEDAFTGNGPATILLDYEKTVVKDIDSREVVYEIQPNDEIEAFEFLYQENGKDTYIHVRCPNGEIGYIRLHKNYFEDLDYKLIEILEVDGKETRVYSVNAEVWVSAIFLKDIPSENGKNIKQLWTEEEVETCKNQRKKFNIIATTDDEKWLKIRADDTEGWISYTDVDPGKGGPLFRTPYYDIKNFLFSISDYL